jgi:hypothetical protein
MRHSSEDYSYFAYLDVLGYRSLLKEDRENNELVFKEKLINSFNIFNDVNSSIYHYNAISDSIFIRCNNRDRLLDFLSLVKKVYISFIEQGLFLRGGISFGKHFENDRITYSYVLTKAYELEQQVAFYPRIIIDNNIITMMESQKKTLVDSKLILRTGNIYFLNIIDPENWLHIYECAKSMYNTNIESINEDESARIKHMLFQNYLIEMIPSSCEAREPYIKMESSW